MQVSKTHAADKDGHLSFSGWCFLVFFTLCLFAKGIGLVDGEMPYYLLTGLGLVFLALKLVSERHTVFEWVWIILLMVLGLMVYHVTGEKGLFLCLCVVVGMKGMEQYLRRIFKVSLVVMTVCFAAMWILTMTGMKSEDVYLHSKHFFGDIICHSMGYPHSNVMHVCLFVIFCLGLYLAGKRSRKRTILWFFLLSAVNVIVFLYSMSYTGLIACELYLILNAYLSRQEHLPKLIRILAYLVLPLCLLFILVGPVVLSGRVFQLIDKALTNRYRLSQYYLMQYPMTLLGQNFAGEDYHNVMDSSWVFLLRQYGIIAFLFFVLLYFGLIRDEIRKERHGELAITLSTVIAGTTEQFLFNTSFKNISLLFVGIYLYKVSDRISNHLPSAFRRELRFLPVGENVVPEKLCILSTVYYFLRRIFLVGTWRRKTVSVVCGLVLGLLVGFLVVKPVTYVFVGYRNNLYRDEIFAEYFTEEEAEELTENGALFYAPVGKDNDVYRYSGQVARSEYDRRILFWGLLGSGIAYAVSGMVVAYRHKEK